MPSDLALFYVFAAAAVVSSLGVVGQGNPARSVLLLAVSSGALAGLHVLLDAPLAAIAQIVVFPGATLVLFLFVLRSLEAPCETPPDPDARPEPLGARAAGALLSATLVAQF